MVRLSKLELRVMEAFWTAGSGSIRDIQQTFPAKARPAYTTVQTIVYRLEAKKALRRAKKISNADIFEPQITRSAAHRRLVEDFLALFGGQTQPVMAHLIQSGRLTLEDIQDAERTLRLSLEETAKMISGLLNHLWQSTVCAGIAGLLTLLLRHHSARIRYGLWFAASVKFLVPFFLLVTLGRRWRQRMVPLNC